MTKKLRDTGQGTCECRATDHPVHETELNAEIRIRLGDLIAPLVTAVKQRKSWIEDFTDDRVTVSTDLYEVLRAFDGYRLEDVTSG